VLTVYRSLVTLLPATHQIHFTHLQQDTGDQVVKMIEIRQIADLIYRQNSSKCSLTHWHTQTSLRRLGSLGPLIHSRLLDAIQRPTQHHSTTGVC